MLTTTDRKADTQRTGIPRRYDTEMEKRLMVDNLRLAVEIYGKDQLRKQFKSRKKEKYLQLGSASSSSPFGASFTN